MPVDTRLTYDDFCLLPEDGKRREIIEGELFVTPSPQTPHQRAVMRLSVRLWQFVDSHELGEVFSAPFDVVFSEFDVVEPDLLYISNARAGVLTHKNVQGAPDLVVEVLSESTSRVDRSIKLKLYGKFGVQEYWIIDPEGPSAEIYRRGEEGLDLVAKLSATDALNSPMFPGFSVPLRELTD
ncbi:MAG: Uma2 family endonuclease [Terriglobia bacterium]|jgi:Uma2 family endonuclease